MSGHSKWSQIKHKKEITDRQKGQLFSKLAKKIAMAAKDDPNPVHNFKLQTVIDEARNYNMPKDNIERAIKKAADKENAALYEVHIDTMGPGGVAVVIEGITDNKNRTIAEIRTILGKHDFKPVPEGSLNWMFDHEKNPIAPIEITNPDLNTKIEKLFEDLDNHDDVENVYSNIK